jgi:hypothetical protein
VISNNPKGTDGAQAIKCINAATVHGGLTLGALKAFGTPFGRLMALRTFGACGAS